MGSKFFEEALKNVPKDSKIFAKKSLDIIDAVHILLEQKGMTQKDLAKKLGKSESEISKWLSGLHNLTLKSIAKLESVLDDDIIIINKEPIKRKWQNKEPHTYLVEPSVLFFNYMQQTKRKIQNKLFEESLN
jgi:transcriptional regulator with XRE-family HTH domain